MNYRKRYPVQNLNKKFYLVSFKGKFILFDIKDIKNKKYYHISAYQTAKDLNFTDKTVYNKKNFEEIQEEIKISNNISITKEDYENGGIIDTTSS